MVMGLSYIRCIIIICTDFNNLLYFISVSKSKEILKLKVKGVYFIVDVIGSLPLDLFSVFIDFETGRRMRPLLKLNQLIGMVKVCFIL